eukprot:m.224007 g.224007  ORF g.224007 m.224007 type:complete len:121 (+) comp16376_c0_seq1:1-363(+)
MAARFLPVIRRGFATAAKEDIRQIGNYPDFPAVSSQVKSPHGFWDPQDRRNFGDKVHENDDILSGWVVDTTYANGRVNNKQAFRELLTALALLAGLYGLASFVNRKDRHPARPRDVPKPY